MNGEKKKTGGLERTLGKRGVKKKNTRWQIKNDRSLKKSWKKSLS